MRDLNSSNSDRSIGQRFLCVFVYACSSICLFVASADNTNAADGSKYYHSDSSTRYIHRIHLYDADNNKISPESTTPFSTVKTCGRCHDYETISHGWHFNAFSTDAVTGRNAEPWIWTDSRTGTQLPLSYRNWKHTSNPNDVGISPFEMTNHFGGRIPGGGVGQASELAANAQAEPNGTEAETDDGRKKAPSPRWQFSGSLEIDCLVCHAVSGAYDFNARREQIAEQNFSWAPTAGFMLGSVTGEVSSIKDDADPEDEATIKKLPVVSYNASRFDTDGTVFIDLIRQPHNNACFACHSNQSVDENGIQARWTHDEDVHLRAGMQCVDCHRNGIDHHIVRGFEAEKHPSGQSVVTLSCAGCHLGEYFASHTSEETSEAEPIHSRAGRLGSPTPQHKGLPPIHFEKLSCTACHGGPAPREKALGVMTSLAHGLGEKGHRSGEELPLIAAPVFALDANNKVAPQRAMWPAFWATMDDGKLKPIPPEQAYQLTRRSLRVRKDFQTELMKPRLKSSELNEILGEDRAKTKEDEWTKEEAAKVAEAQSAAGKEAFNEKVYASLSAIEKELGVEQAAYVSSGVTYVKGDEEDTLKEISDAFPSSRIVLWPTAHSVRPAGWSLGVTGCTECHSEKGKIFASTVSPIGPGPNQTRTFTMAQIQGVDEDQRLAWNEMFAQRSVFKYVIASSIAVLLITLLVGTGATFARKRQNA